ncbi:MAG: shikimate kinase [Lachnospiraceae bacterium]
MKNVVLMGFMGAGKTTVGKMLAGAEHYQFIDTDEQIEKEQNRKISDIFDQDGEEAFRQMETDYLRKLEAEQRPFVLSIGGGMPVREENRELLRKLGIVVYLEASKETIIQRVSGDVNRPLLQGGSLEEKVTALMNAREAVYLETAHAVLNTDGDTAETVIKKIKDLL